MILSGILCRSSKSKVLVRCVVSVPGIWMLESGLVAARSRSLASEINIYLPFNEIEHVTSTYGVIM
jgi:hypothetical protein